MKKLLSILAVLAIVLSCSVMGIGTVLAAPDESSEDDFMAFDGVLEEYVGAGGDVVIPASLGIKEIAAQAFANNTDITSIVIPEGVEIVGYWSFRACTSIESITLPYSLCELAAAKKAKELEALKAELEALKGGDTAAVEEAPVDETPAE